MVKGMIRKVKASLQGGKPFNKLDYHEKDTINSAVQVET